MRSWQHNYARSGLRAGLAGTSPSGLASVIPDRCLPFTLPDNFSQPACASPVSRSSTHREGEASERGQCLFSKGAGIRRISGGGCQDKARPAVFLWSAVDRVPFTQAQDQETPVSVLDIAEETQVAEKIAPECSQGAAQGLAQVSGVIPGSEASLESRSSTFNENRPKKNKRRRRDKELAETVLLPHTQLSWL